MITTRKPQDDDLQYRKFICKICDEVLFRTIENSKSAYFTPSIIIHCSSCASKYTVKYFGKDISFELININKHNSKPKIKL